MSKASEPANIVEHRLANGGRGGISRHSEHSVLVQGVERLHWIARDKQGACIPILQQLRHRAIAPIAIKHVAVRTFTEQRIGEKLQL